MKNGDKATKKEKTKLLEKWKARARKGTKQFFEKQVVYLMENPGAYQKYLSNIDAGRNPIDPAVAEAAPASPERSTESGTAQEQQPPTTPTRTGNEQEQEQEENILE